MCCLQIEAARGINSYNRMLRLGYYNSYPTRLGSDVYCIGVTSGAVKWLGSLVLDHPIPSSKFVTASQDNRKGTNCAVNTVQIKHIQNLGLGGLQGTKKD